MRPSASSGQTAQVLLAVRWRDVDIVGGWNRFAAVAQGATAAFVDRAYLYAPMAGREHGVDRALGMFREGITRTMQLLGVTFRHRSSTAVTSGCDSRRRDT